MVGSCFRTFFIVCDALIFDGRRLAFDGDEYFNEGRSTLRVIIHDFGKEMDETIKKLYGKDEEVTVISDDGTIKDCIGCFGCWIKTPGQCVLSDDYQTLGALLGKTSSLLIICKCTYGTYSPFIRNVLDRSLSYVHPDFTMREGEIHHKLRYSNRVHVTIFFYGNTTMEEQETAKNIVYGNAINFNFIVKYLNFFTRKEEVLHEDCANLWKSEDK